MHLAFFTHTYPAPNSNGGAEICYAKLKEFKKKGIKVSLFIYAVEEYYNDCIKNYNKIKVLADNVHVFKADMKISLFNAILKNPYLFFKPQDEMLLPSYRFEKETHDLLKRYNPDKAYIYDWYACPPVLNYKIDKMMIVGDLLFAPHFINLKYRKLLGYEEFFYNNFSFEKIKKKISSHWTIYQRKKIQKKLFKNCKYGGCFGKYDADWLFNYGIKQSKYYPTPYNDTSTEDFLNYEKRISIKKEKFKIATGLGRLNATATSSGLYLLLNEILPKLNERIGSDKFEIHVYGDGYLRGGLEGLKNHKNIFIRGYVDDIDAELLSSDIFLLATPFLLGYRARVINCLARALPLVLHKSDTINQPELIDNYNCVFGNTSDEIVEKMIQLLTDLNKRKKIMKAARETYLKVFRPSIAVENIIREFKND